LKSSSKGTANGGNRKILYLKKQKSYQQTGGVSKNVLKRSINNKNLPTFARLKMDLF
jgi:hypothetical protein